MELYQERVLEELQEVEGRLVRLRKFIGEVESPAWVGMEREEKWRMEMQERAMSLYAGILKERVKHFR